MHASPSSAPRVRHRFGLAMIVATFAFAAGEASPNAPAPAPQDAPAAAGPNERVEEAGRIRLARLLTRTSLELLRLQEPTASDYKVAMILSEWSTELAPDWLGC